MASQTPNLDLLKKDPVIDGNDTFNIETMLNENWDKIDEAIGDVRQELEDVDIETSDLIDGVRSEVVASEKAVGDLNRDIRNELHSRLDIEDSTDVTLQPGLQVINAVKDARFRLGEVRGRTLINLLGDRGACESISSSHFLGRVTTSVDTSVKQSGTASIKVLSDTTAASPHYFRFMNTSGTSIPVAENENVLYGAWVKPLANSRVTLKLVFQDSSGNTVISTKDSSVVIDSSKFSFAYVTNKAPAGAAFALLQLSILDASGRGTFDGTGAEGFNVDSAFIYKITDAELTSIGGMTPEQIAAKYPFVPSGIVGVENPFALATSDNLLPPFYEWELSSASAGNSKITTPYTFELFPQQFNAYTRVGVDVFPGTDYTLCMEHNGMLAVSDGDGTIIVDYISAKSVRFNSGDSRRIYVFVSNGSDAIYNCSFSNPMLTIGTETQPFHPQRKSMLAFDTEIHANPTDGSDPDVLFEQNGQYFKLAKWKKVVLDGSLPWGELYNTYTGYKRVGLAAGVLPLRRSNTNVTKYDGILLAIAQSGSEVTGGDFAQFLTSGPFYIWIKNSDSGWGDNYAPTADEIKAYFNGWKMLVEGQAKADPYNGTGPKAWYAVSRIADTYESQYARTTLPTDKAPNKDTWAPYQLLYRLAKETVEPVVTEGSLLLSEGDNMIEVGTGIVLRERGIPSLNTSTGSYFINYYGNLSAITVNSPLKYKVADYLSVCAEDKQTYQWLLSGAANSDGTRAVVILAPDYDPTAAYSVTYIKLDKSPIQPIIGVLAANEKARISDLTAGVAEALQRVSVAEMKKAEKDAPGWIMPTLLNGWGNYDSLRYSDAGFMKDSIGYVHLRGMIAGGALNPGVVIFKLPEGYRPKKHVMIGAVCSDGEVPYPALVNVSPNGDVSLTRIGYNGFLSLYLSPFSTYQ